jgi:galactose mutarotase-like enzyme
MSTAESNVYILSNSELVVEFIPVEGGRISSLRSVRSGIEFLTQSRRRGPCVQAGLNTRFQDGFCAGIEECLPTVGFSGPETEGGPVPDHGDFWQIPWRLLFASDAHARMSAIGFSRPLRFTKKITLERNELRVAYEVVNEGSATQSFLYACHPLFAISAGDRVRLPGQIRELTLDYSKGDRLGRPGSRIDWPVTQVGVRLDLALGPQSGSAEMFYSSRLTETVCGIYRKTSRHLVEVSFDAERLPYLGLWLCYGGWPGDCEEPQQYAVALEPTTSPCNNLAKAQQTRTGICLNPGEKYEWEILFSVKEDVADTALI